MIPFHPGLELINSFPLFGYQAFDLAVFPLLSQKLLGYENIEEMKEQKDSPEEDRPDKPVNIEWIDVFPDLKQDIDYDQENRTDQENDEMLIKPSFLTRPSLGPLKEFPLFRIQFWASGIF